MARKGQICPTNYKLSKKISNQCKTKIFFFTFLESLGKFRNCHRDILINLLYSWLNFNVLGLVGQICPSLVMIGLRRRRKKKKNGSISRCQIGSQKVISCWPRTSSPRNRIRTPKPKSHCTVLKDDRWYVDMWHVIPPPPCLYIPPYVHPYVPPQKKSFLLVLVIPSASVEGVYVSRHYKCPIS